MLFSCLAFTACGSNDNNLLGEITVESIQAKYDADDYYYNGDAVTINVATWDSAGKNMEDSVMKIMVQAFNNRYPNITIKYDIMSNYETNYANNIAVGNLHDVFLVSDGVFANWAESGMLENLEPYIANSDLIDRDDMIPSVINRYSFNKATGKAGSGNQYTLARDISSFVMYYNKDYFDEMGVEYPASDRTMTIEEATTMWKALTKKDSKGNIEVYGTSALDICGLVWSAGGDFLNDERNAFPTDASDINALKKAYQFVQDSYYVDEICPTVALDAATMFSMQKVACAVAGSWNVGTFRSLDFNWDVAYIPAFEENPGANCWSGSCGYSVWSGSKKKEAAWKFVEYFSSKEGQEILWATGTQIPIYKSLSESGDLIQRESSLGPTNYKVITTSATTQPEGRWCYLKNQQWTSLGYDALSAGLLNSDADKRWTVDKYLDEVKGIVNSYVG